MLPKQSIDTSDIRVLKCVHEYKTTMKLMKTQIFSLFHQCEYNCVKNIKSTGVEMCFNQCEKDLDDFFEQKQRRKLNKDVFYALPIYDKTQNKQYLIPEDQALEYQKRTILFEQAAQFKIADLRKLIAERTKQYTSK